MLVVANCSCDYACFLLWTLLWFLWNVNNLVGMGGMYDTGLLSLVLQYLINITDIYK